MKNVPLHLDLTDPRGHDRFLRLSWHRERRAIIVSHWRDGICVATTWLEPDRFASIISFFATALSEAALAPSQARKPVMQRNWFRGLVDRGRLWLQPRLASVVAIAERHQSPRASGEKSA